jgi:hypothetical protein
VRRRARTARPFFVLMRERNPCTFMLRRFFGWYVRFVAIESVFVRMMPVICLYVNKRPFHRSAPGANLKHSRFVWIIKNLLVKASLPLCHLENPECIRGVERSIFDRSNPCILLMTYRPLLRRGDKGRVFSLGLKQIRQVPSDI